MQRQAEFIAEFNSLSDWRERYQYLCDLADDMPEMPEPLKIPKNRLQGCQSTLYFQVSANPSIHVQAWGNSAISFGMAALMARLFNGLTPGELHFLPITFHIETGLLDNLTFLRRQGLLEMITLLKRSC